MNDDPGYEKISLVQNLISRVMIQEVNTSSVTKYKIFIINLIYIKNIK